MTKRGLYFVIFEKYAEPNAPRPRGAKIRPPVQQSVAKIAVKIDDILNNFSFTFIPPTNLAIIQYYHIIVNKIR